MAPDPLSALLQDEQLKQQLIRVLAARGGYGQIFHLRSHFPSGRRQKPVPMGIIRQYFRALPSDFILAGSSEVALTHTAAAAADVEVAQRRARPRHTTTNASLPHECKLCNKAFATLAVLEQHMGGAQHRIKQAVSLLKEQGVLMGDQQGIVVSNLAIIKGIRVGKSVSGIIQATNTNGHSVQLLRFGLLRRTSGVSANDEFGRAADSDNGCAMGPGEIKIFTATFTPKAVGVLMDVLVLEFDGFTMMRELTAECEPDLGPGMPSIEPVAPFVKKATQVFARPPQDYEPGEAPPRSRHMWKNPPGDTRVPKWLEDMVAEGRMGGLEAILHAATPTMTTFVTKLQRLLWVEELQHEVDIRQYDMQSVTMEANRAGNMILKVPGLAENRPSVMRGDALFVRSTAGGQEYQGYVHMVRQEELYLRFSPNFHNRVFIPNMRFNVRFAISRSTFVFMQAALQKANMSAIHPATLLGAAGLAPGAALKQTPPSTQEPAWTTVSPINEEQKIAVRAILSGAHAPLPYLIFGPPGTGKTMTMTEAAVQLFKADSGVGVLSRLLGHRPKSKLLLTAPSNSAADQLALRMLEKGVPASSVMRVSAYSRPKDDMPIELQRLSNWNEAEGAFLLDEALLSTILSKRVVVSTCLMAAKLHALGVPAGHFTHIFIDEAGHAEEPLSLAAVAGLITSNDSARLILAGDPKQLGPVILSPLAQRLGLATSAMERLINVEPYARKEEPGAQPYNTTYITKLINNYRSHPDLLSLPNRLFYNGELLPKAASDITHSLLGFRKLPNPSFPIIFHSVVGRDEREASSPSWFNQMEAKLIVEYIMALQDMKSNRPAPGDMGVISPYRKQVQKIRTLLNAKYGNSIKVGSTEEFQGQERRVILISTVRSSVEHLEFDTKHRLGFLSNPKRFNVALTRAKALVIVVGNPGVLCKDPNWMAFLVYCQRNNACVGSAMPEDVVNTAAAANAASSTSAPGTSESSLWNSMTALADRLLGLSISRAPAGPEDPTTHGFMRTAPIQVEGGEMPRLE